LDTHPDYSWATPGFAAFASTAGQYVPSLIGAALMVLAIGLSQRVTLAWGATIIMLCAGAVITAMQSERAWVPASLIIAALSISPFRDAYYRQARVISDTLRPGTLVPLLALLGSVVWLANFEPKLRGLAQTSWWEVVAGHEAASSVRLAMGLAVLLLLGALWAVIRPGRVTWLPWNADTRARFVSLGGEPPADAEGVVFSEGQRAAIAVRRAGAVVLAIGDPVGVGTDRLAAIWCLRDLAVQEARTPAIWHAGAEFLKSYADLGLTALKLDADGMPAELPDSAGQTYLCCNPEQDLGELLPILRALGQTGRFFASKPRGAERNG